MGKLTRVTYLRMGLHSSGSEWLTMPGTLAFLEPVAGAEVVTDYERSPRDLERGDGLPYSALNGLKVGQLNNLQLPVYGLSGSGAGNGTDSSTLGAGPVGDLFTALTGATATDATGEATAASPGTGTALTLDAAATDLAAGGAILVEGGTSGELQARFATAVSGTSVTLDRALTTSVGASENPAASSTVYAGRVWNFDFDNGDHTHVAFDAEGQDWRRRLLGCLGNATLAFPRGGQATLSGSFVASDWEDTAEASPTFSAPTQGEPVRVIHSPLWIGSTLYMGWEYAFDFGLTLEDRTADGAPQGRYGHVVTGKAPMLSFKLHAGALTTPSEVSDSFLATLQGGQTSTKTTQSLLVQVGRTAGATMAITMPAAEITARRVREGGQYAIQCTAYATRHATRAACSLAVF